MPHAYILKGDRFYIGSTEQPRFSGVGREFEPLPTHQFTMKFYIKNIPIEVFLGVSDDERAKKQQISASISFDFDTTRAEKSDDLADSVDYFAIREFARNFPQNREFRLLEHFHREIFEQISAKFPVKNLKIQLEKFPFESGSVKIEN